MLVSPSSLKSPPPRARAQTRTSGRVASPCVLCSPPAREIVSSPFDSQVKTCDDPVALMVETWCYPTLVSPAGRQCSVMQLQQHQGAGPVDIGNPFLEDEQWDMEAMALCTIAGQLEDEEEEEEEEGEALDSVGDGEEYEMCGESHDVVAFSGWALQSPSGGAKLSAMRLVCHTCFRTLHTWDMIARDDEASPVRGCDGARLQMCCGLGVGRKERLGQPK